MRILLFLCLWSQAALALVCPLCGARVPPPPAPTARVLGADRDMFRHTEAEAGVLGGVVGCPRCLYSAYREDFGLPLTAPQRARCRTELKSPAPAPFPQWARYDLAGQVMRVRGATLEQQAFHELVTSWCVRAETNPFAPEASGVPPGEDWAQKEIALGTPYLLRRHGENLEHPPAMALEAIERERFYQRRAVELYQRLRESTPEPARRAELAYLLGELHRRLGLQEPALLWFNEVRGESGCSERLLRWAREQRALVRRPPAARAWWLLVPLVALGIWAGSRRVAGQSRA